MDVGTVTALWRYPVKSMVGESVATSAVDRRALHGDRMWAVRDLELNAVTTARRLPMLLGCSARFVEEPPPGVGPGDRAEVVVTFPDGAEISSADRDAMDARLSELTGKRVALVPLPPLEDKAAYRGVVASQKDLRSQFGIAEGEPLPDLSMFPVRKLAQLALYATPIGIFADAYPLHIVTTASLRAMAAHGGDTDVRRFRPNIVIESDADGLVEQQWIGGVLRAGGLGARIEIPTVRCTVPVREQVGLPADPEVMRSVSRFGDRCLGVYADVAAAGVVRVGDPVEVDPARASGGLSASLGRLAGRVKRNAITTTTHRILPR